MGSKFCIVTRNLIRRAEVLSKVLLEKYPKRLTKNTVGICQMYSIVEIRVIVEKALEEFMEQVSKDGNRDTDLIHKEFDALLSFAEYYSKYCESVFYNENSEYADKHIPYPAGYVDELMGCDMERGLCSGFVLKDGTYVEVESRCHKEYVRQHPDEVRDAIYVSVCMTSTNFSFDEALSVAQMEFLWGLRGYFEKNKSRYGQNHNPEETCLWERARLRMYDMNTLFERSCEKAVEEEMMKGDMNSNRSA